MRFPNMGGEQNIEGRFLGLRSEAIIRSMAVLLCCVWLNWWHLSWNLYKRATEFVDCVLRCQNYRQGEAKRRRSNNLYRDRLHCGLGTFQLLLISLCNDRNLGNKVFFEKGFPFGWVSWLWQRCSLKAWLMQYLINSSLLQLGSESSVRRLFTNRRVSDDLFVRIGGTYFHFCLVQNLQKSESFILETIPLFIFWAKSRNQNSVYLTLVLWSWPILIRPCTEFPYQFS